MERVVRPQEAAGMLGISVSTLYEWLANPPAPEQPLPRPRQVGGRAVGWPLSVLEEYIRGLPETHKLPRSTRRRNAVREAAT
jgi:predicted DNA-binding transcriptional regulator AlpA